MDDKITISGIFTKQINFSMQQNFVPVIRNLIVTNHTTETLLNLDLKISFQPEFAKEFTYHIAQILPEESVEIAHLHIHMKHDYLFSITEKIIGSIEFCVTQKQEKTMETIYSSEHEIQLLAYDQWSGILVMPEIISAFVTPNHPSITQLIVKASEFLNQWTHSPSFTGYQTQNPEHVKFQMAAIYHALQSESIIYNNPQISYETIGQRIRLPHIVLSQKMGTCLDLAVLYSTCLESVGLHPLLCFISGHAFCGCWLEPESFADCVIDDIDTLIKRTDTSATDILLVECTDFVSGKSLPFDKAVKHGNDRLINQEAFHCVIDITRSRGNGIRPMAIQLEQAYQSAPVSDNIGTTPIAQMPSALDMSLKDQTLRDATPLTKQKVWERKLLDFSLRNTLLNFRVNKNAFQLLVANLAELEDQLADGKDFRIMETPNDVSLTLRDLKMYEIETNKDIIQTIAQKEFESSRIRTFLDAETLDKNLKSLYRTAKMNMEENGSNTLFLALGFLKWFESDIAEKVRYAPIILIPVDIVHNRKNAGYVLRSRQEDAQINITLLEYLKQDYNITIDGLDPLPEDEHGILKIWLLWGYSLLDNLSCGMTFETVVMN